MPKLSWLRGLIVPVSILSILLVAFVAYYLYWVPSRQRLLDDRGFRYLKTLSDQIQLTINTYDKMLDNAVGSGVIDDTTPATLSNIEKFLSNIAPQLVLAQDTEVAQVIGQDFGDPPKIAINADEGTHFLYLAFRHELDEGVKLDGKKELSFAVRTDFDQLINRLLGANELSPFDVVLISETGGKVIFQKSLSGVAVSQLKKLDDASGKVKEKREIDVDWLSPASRLEEVWIAGARYRLYSQPLQVGFQSADPTGKHPADTSESWVLCGLVRADRFRSESQLIPYSYILMMLAAILLAAASYPFMKLYLSAPGERLRARDVTLIAIFAGFIAAVLTFIVADVYFWNSSFGPAAERDMATLARAMKANFRLERDAAVSLLDTLNQTNEIKEPLQQSEDHLKLPIHVCYYENDPKLRKTCNQGKQPCEPPWACRVNILKDKDVAEHFEAYPYPMYAFWSDSTGHQRIKWTTRKRTTPFIPLDDPSVPYYPEIRRALGRQVDSQAVPTLGIGSQYSPTTGQNITTFWKVPPDPKGREAEDYKEKRYAVTLVAQPISLYNAVLPGGYQFAVLTPDGTVVFHSDTTRNLRENFFAETSQNPNLRSRVRMHSEGAATANYMGRPHRMYVMPMDAANQDGPWTIVIFRDLHLEEVLNVEMLSLVTILFLLYAAAIALVMIAVHRLRKGRAAHWFWPDSRKAQAYRPIALINLLAVILLLVLSRFVPPAALLLCAALIPAGVLVSAVVLVGNRDNLQAMPGEQDRDASNQWQSAYFWAATSLVVLVAVLPCLCFFKVAADLGQSLLVKHTLLKLAGDFDNRALTMQALYQDVKLGNFKARILTGPDGQDALPLLATPPPSSASLPVFSYHRLLNNTEVLTEQQPHDGSVVDATDERAFLSALAYPYNETADDDRHLLEGKSDVGNWTSRQSGRDNIVKLTWKTTDKLARSITAVWRPFYFPWGRWVWLLGVAGLVAAVYWLVRLSFSRIFLLNLVAPPPSKAPDPELNPYTLMTDLPMNLLLIGPETCQPIAHLLHRSDVQVREAEEVLRDVAAADAKPAGASGATGPAADPIDVILRDGRPLVLRNFERLPDNSDTAAKTLVILLRLLSALGNSIIIVSTLDPILISSIEASERWRSVLRSFVRIDFHDTPRQRVDEDDAVYDGRISAASYFHWLFAGLRKPEKLVMLQLAREHVVNPSSSQIVYELMEQGFIERRNGLLTIADAGFAKFLPRALPHDTVKLWEKEMAGTGPFSLQTSLLIVGVGTVAFLIYTQGEVFNTWVAYATGVASAVPKALQFFENLQGKSAAKSE